MAVFRGGLPPLDMSGCVSDNWKLWSQKFKNYLKANEIDKKPESMQCAQLLHYIGDEGVKIFNTFKLKHEEVNKIKPLLRAFDRHFGSKTNLIYERHKFFTRKQLNGESVQQFLTDLKYKAKTCNFGHLEDSLICSVLIIGLVDESLRSRLLEKSDLTLAKAEQKCKGLTETRKQGKKMTEEVREKVNEVRANKSFSDRAQTNTQKPNYDRKSSKASSSAGGASQARFNSGGANGTSQFPPKGVQMITNCYKCGSTHQIKKCPAFGKQCTACGGFNHFQNRCRNNQVHLVSSIMNEMLLSNW